MSSHNFTSAFSGRDFSGLVFNDINKSIDLVQVVFVPDKSKWFFFVFDRNARQKKSASETLSFLARTEAFIRFHKKNYAPNRSDIALQYCRCAVGVGFFLANCSQRNSSLF